jgi:hypothetical protein
MRRPKPSKLAGNVEGRAMVADVDALHRLVGVLALNRQSGDLGRLIGEEAWAIRRDVHRELIETIERRVSRFSPGGPPVSEPGRRLVTEGAAIPPGVSVQGPQDAVGARRPRWPPACGRRTWPTQAF